MEIHKGNYRGTINFIAEAYEVDEEYQEYIETLSREALEEELINLKLENEVLKDMGF